jgi:hypothetical protein
LQKLSDTLAKLLESHSSAAQVVPDFKIDRLQRMLTTLNTKFEKHSVDQALNKDKISTLQDDLVTLNHTLRYLAGKVDPSL